MSDARPGPAPADADAAPLVLLHGLNNTPAVFDAGRAALASRLAAAMPVQAPDVPVHETVEAVAQSLLAQLPARFSLAGFSFGGYVAMAMLEQAPERIARFALVCSTSRADSDTTRDIRARTIEAIAAGGFEKVLARQAPLTVHPDRLGDAALMGFRLQLARDYGPERLTAHLRACMARPDRTEVLAAYRGPTMMLAAADDQIVPADGMREVAERAGIERFAAVPRCGHMLPIERPEAFAQQLANWLEQGEA